MARKTFKFRLYPNRQQRDKLHVTLDVCRELYNAGLQERIDAWKNRTPVKCYDQIKAGGVVTGLLHYCVSGGSHVQEIYPHDRRRLR